MSHKKLLAFVCIITFVQLTMFAQETKDRNLGWDYHFLNQLRVVGVWDACQELNIDFEAVFAPLAQHANHPYRRYRWSVSYDENGKSMINAFPPEEESGWTPWERWSIVDGIPKHTEWVQYPIKTTNPRNIVPWYKLSESVDLTPRFNQVIPDMEFQLRLARVDVAADWLGLDFEKVFIKSLSPELRETYRHFRWVVVPHILAANGPVIYNLPPMNKSDDWPWESWYTDGITPIIHHVHYTKKSELSTGSWSERTGAPQRPPEIYEHLWFWHDDLDMVPALSKSNSVKK